MYKPIKTYERIISTLEAECSGKILKEVIKDVCEKFKKEVQKQFKIPIIFDVQIKLALIKRIQDQHKINYFNQQFAHTLNFINQFSKCLLKQKFISNRNLEEIVRTHNKYFDHPVNKKLKSLTYLRNANDKSEFREQFFSRFKQISEEQEDLMEDDDFCKPKYQQFWKQLLNQKPPKNVITFFDSCFSQFQNKTDMLSEQIISEIQHYIGDEVGRSLQQLQCNKILKQIAIKNSFQVNTEVKNKINRQYQMIVNVLQKFCGQSKFLKQNLQLRVAKFGSLVSGFCGKDADLDITLLTNNYVSQKNLLEYLRDYLQIQFKERDRLSGKKTRINYIQASNPLVEVLIQEGRRGESFKIDILVNSILGVVNSNFLNVYSQIPWVKHLAILIKYWGKGDSHRVIDKHLLSSYGIVLMLLHFLIKKKKVNLIYDARNRSKEVPNFIYKRNKNEQFQQFEVYYMFKTNKQDVTKIQNVNLVEVLKEFFYFYSKNGEHWITNQGRNIISVDGATRQFDQECAITIRDPFDKFHNPGRLKALHATVLQQNFSQAYQKLDHILLKESGEKLRVQLQKLIMDN